MFQMLRLNVFFLVPENVPNLIGLYFFLVQYQKMFRMLEDEYIFPFTGKCSKHVTVLHVRESSRFVV
jgi:hypothetical protein